MRKQIDGLALLAKEVIRQDPSGSALFGFISARRNKLKLLVCERTDQTRDMNSATGLATSHEPSWMKPLPAA